MTQRTIIYDIDEKDQDILIPFQNDILFSAQPTVKSCMGCFGCWIKTPGKCVIFDRGQKITEYFSKSQEIIIITPILYGGYSVNVKMIIDRSIGHVLPYFRYVNGQMHHQLRYDDLLKLKVYFYGESDHEEKEIAKRLVEANALNLGIKESEVYFYDSIDMMRKEFVEV